jgi:hypothetical protein
MPLSVAAAIAFHTAQRGTKAIRSPLDYMEALNIAAAALSRLIPIYAMDKALRTRVTFDVLHGEFSVGATEFHRHDGSIVTALSVVRGDLASALSFMREVGPTLAFALGRERSREAAPAREAAEEP